MFQHVVESVIVVQSKFDPEDVLTRQPLKVYPVFCGTLDVGGGVNPPPYSHVVGMLLPVIGIVELLSEYQ